MTPRLPHRRLCAAAIAVTAVFLGHVVLSAVSCTQLARATEQARSWRHSSIILKVQAQSPLFCGLPYALAAASQHAGQASDASGADEQDGARHYMPGCSFCRLAVAVLAAPAPDLRPDHTIVLHAYFAEPRQAASLAVQRRYPIRGPPLV